MTSAQCHGRLIAILESPMTLFEAHYRVNQGVSGSDPEYVSLKEVFDAAIQLVVQDFIKVVGKRPPGSYDIVDGACSMHVYTKDDPLLTFEATRLGLSVAVA